MTNDKQLKKKVARVRRQLELGFEVTMSGLRNVIEYKKHYGEYTSGFLIHHIDFDKKNVKPGNMVAMHRDCYLRYNDPNNRSKAKLQTRQEILEWSTWYYNQLQAKKTS